MNSFKLRRTWDNWTFKECQSLGDHGLTQMAPLLSKNFDMKSERSTLQSLRVLGKSVDNTLWRTFWNIPCVLCHTPHPDSLEMGFEQTRPEFLSISHDGSWWQIELPMHQNKPTKLNRPEAANCFSWCCENTNFLQCWCKNPGSPLQVASEHPNFYSWFQTHPRCCRSWISM